MMQSGVRLFRLFGPLFLTLVLIAGAVAPARAQSGTNAWGVRNVPVDVTAENATAARERAIVQGQRAAFDRLTERLMAPEDRAALPRPSDAELSGMIQNFEVQEERLSSVRYVAKLAFGFRPDAVRAYLNRTGTRYADAAARPLLVLPVLRTEADAKLWEEPNPWREAWASAQLGNRLTPIIVPLGDVLDVGNVSADAAIAGRPDGLGALLQRYSAEYALIAIARDTGEAIEVTMSIAGPQGATPADSFSVPVSADAKRDQKYGKAVEAAAQRLEEGWKRQTMSGRSGTPLGAIQAGGGPQIEVGTPPTQGAQPAGGNRMAIVFPISGLADWTELRSRLARLPNNVRMDLKSLTRNSAEFDLVYAGDEEGLRQQLAQLGLSANPIGDVGAPGRYEMRLGAGAPAAVQ